MAQPHTSTLSRVHIYLDHNATTPLVDDVIDAMGECSGPPLANPASSHFPGRLGRKVLESAREGVGRALGAEPTMLRGDRVIFTSGGTEANNLALVGLAIGAIGGWNRLPAAAALAPRIAISAIEHPSVVGAAEHLGDLGWRVDRLPVTRDGVVCLDRAAEMLTPDTRLVSVMLGNNETGVLQPVAELAAICRERGILVHTDAVQVAGKLPVDFRALGVDALTVAAHKFHGPLGIGALICRPDLPLAPLLFGGHQQAGIRPGTESVVLAEGMYAALRVWQGDPDGRERHLLELRDSFEADLRAGWPELVVQGENALRLPHTSNVSFPGLDRQALFMALDMAGIACSTGSACASGSNEPSPVLRAMGLDEKVVAGALRFSFGATNTLVEVRTAAARVLEVARRLAAPKKRRSETPRGLKKPL